MNPRNLSGDAAAAIVCNIKATADHVSDHRNCLTIDELARIWNALDAAAQRVNRRIAHHIEKGAA